MKTTKTTLCILIAAVLAGCQYPSEHNLSPYFGEAVRQNLRAQIINPNPPTDLGTADSNGQRTAAALQRYYEHRVIQPNPYSSSSLRGNTNGGGGNGAGTGDGAAR